MKFCVSVWVGAAFTTPQEQCYTFNANVSCPLCCGPQESPVREPSESKLCEPAGLRTQHHRQSAVYERRGPQQRHAGTSA